MNEASERARTIGRAGQTGWQAESGQSVVRVWAECGENKRRQRASRGRGSGEAACIDKLATGRQSSVSSSDSGSGSGSAAASMLVRLLSFFGGCGTRPYAVHSIVSEFNILRAAGAACRCMSETER